MIKVFLNNNSKKIKLLCMIISLSMILLACAGMDPRKVDVELKSTPPRVQTTSYTEALANLGLMTDIYGTDLLLIQSNPIGDETGTASSTGGEIPSDITEMMKSSLNSIGGKVVYIPYDPHFMQYQQATGYSNFSNKFIPNVILSGGITEFDRGLVTKGENTEVSVGYEFVKLTDDFPSKEVRVKYKDDAKEGLARITLDFNLLDFNTMSGIPKMTAVNTMEVHKALGEKELGITILGPTFGLRGSIKKVQGRHAAVRLLVELSTIQMVGKYLIVPYWRLLGDDTTPDNVVMNSISGYFYSMKESERILPVKTWLYLYGYDVPFSEELDAVTREALQKVDGSYNPEANEIALNTFQKVFINIPVTQEALGRRKMLEKLTREQEQAAAAAAARSSEKNLQSPQKDESQEEAASVHDEEDPENAIPPRKGIGKVLSKDNLINILNELTQ